MTDEELIDAYRSDPRSTYFDVLYERYSAKVYAKSISILQNNVLAEDATQEIFIKIVLNLSKFKGQSKFSTWLYSITYNYCIDFIRKKRRTQELVDNGLSNLEDFEEEVEVTDQEILEIKLDRLEGIMKDADPGDRIILMMKYIEKLSIKDISNILNKTESATKMNIMRAKQRLKKSYLKLYNE